MLFQQGEMQRLKAAADAIAQVADRTDADIGEVHQSQALAEEANRQLAPIHAVLDVARGAGGRDGVQALEPQQDAPRLAGVQDGIDRAVEGPGQGESVEQRRDDPGVDLAEAVEEAERDAVGARVDVGRDQPAHPGDLASVRAEALA